MIQKQNVNINFAQGLDTKTDPKQVQIGKFLSLENSIFTKGGLLAKRNGYKAISSLPSGSFNYLTTFNGNLTAIGNSLQAYNAGGASWVNKGIYQPLKLAALPLVRSALNQTQSDSCVSAVNTVCTVFSENNNGTSDYKYQIQDVSTGQYIVNPTLIPNGGSGTITGSPRVFMLTGYFIIVFTNVISAVSHLQYIAVSANTGSVVQTNTDIAAAYTSATTVNWDGVVYGSRLYLAYNTTSGGQQIKVTYLTSSFILAAATAFASSIATIMSMCADQTNPSQPVIYAAFYDSAGSTGNVVAVDQNLNKLMTATQIISSGTVNNITCTAQNGICMVAYEVNNVYSYDSSIKTPFLDKVTVTLPNTVTTGTVGSTTTFLRSVGLGSKAFLMNGIMYMKVAYVSSFQPTYFLCDILGNIISRWAYQNGDSLLTLGLPQAQVVGSLVYVSYLFKDLIEANGTNLGSQGTPSLVNVYSQAGVNLATFDFTNNNISSSEIGQNLNLSGGMLWNYDGQTLSEQDFHIYPDNIECTWSATGGSIHAQPDGSTNTNAYYYQVTYEWSDAQGNIFRSSPSIPVGVTTTSNGTSGSITVNVPYLRLTYKTNVKIVIYRWSVAQEIYYQVTSLTAPSLNVTTSDSLAYVDTLADASITGNNIIYTTGGVIEDIAGPAAIATTLFDDRLWLIDSEDRNLLWYSKQVIEATPVEMSDLLTIYVAPSTGSQGSTGPMSCLSPLDDKLIIFKQNAIYYINGTGPDNTGSNSQYSQPIFITSTVGCANQNSIVFMPDGLMFQSDKGIWLLGRDLSTQYIGAPVEEFNGFTVNSAINVPGTTQVRFTLSNGVTLMYDYYYGQWGTFTNVGAVSSTLYQNLHTFMNSSGAVFQETPSLYQDNGDPVLMSFTTSWINMAGLQGYQRAYFFYLLGQYLSPHKLNLQIAYDYIESAVDSVLISPTNFSPAYGGSSPYGQQSKWGTSDDPNYQGVSDLEQWRVFLKQQRCQSIQISLQEFFDPQFGVLPGAGLTLSGINMIYGTKKGFRPISNTHTAGVG